MVKPAIDPLEKMTSMPGRDLTRRPRAVLAPEIAEVAGSVSARLPDLVDRVVQRVLAEIEFYHDRDVVSLDALRDSVRSNLESMAGQLTTDQPPDLSAPRATGRQRARQGAPLADILHAYRIGFTEFWAAIVDEARRSPHAPWELLVDAASGVWWLIGDYTQELTVAYRETAAELLLAGARERSALVEALFTGASPTGTRSGRRRSCSACPGKVSSWWWSSRRRGLPKRGCRTRRHCWPGVGSGRPGCCTQSPRREWSRCGTPTRPPSCSSCSAAPCAPGPASARSITRWVTPPARCTTRDWSRAACRRGPGLSASSRRRRCGCSRPPPRTRPGSLRARCWDRSWTCLPRTARRC